jgi:hypothetical protein
MDIAGGRHYHRIRMILVLAAAAGAILGLAIGLTVGKRDARTARSGMDEHERILRESVVPVVELRARELGVAFVSIPPPDMARRGPNVSATVGHLANLCNGITEKERTNSMALSDTVQIQRSDLAPLAKIR